MTPIERKCLANARWFLRTVVTLWGDHWQQPCLQFLAEHGYPCTRQSLYNYMTGKRRIPDDIDKLIRSLKPLKGE